VNNMIKIRNLHKYFNKNKANEIHVIDETNLDFPKTGLVCLLGPSGSGKTTLLNVVGGLDKVNSGEIIFDDITLKRYNANKWDNIRNHHFGYIFQNYILLPDLSVYENLEFVLKMLDLKPEEISERIDYALEAVGMVKYKKRKPGQLSGGQQQRIAIARALVKSPDVVIADEPTGNLDEKNTTQIMNIIKKISKECLVILVTHERRLAEFYGDNIIELLDGKIVSQKNIINDDDHLFSLDDHNIYLQEFNQNEFRDEDFNLKYFFQDQKPNIELNIVFKDNTYYINSTKDNVKIKFVDSENEIKIIDSKKPIIKKENIDKFNYHLPKIKKSTKTSRSVIKYKDTFKMSVKNLLNSRKRQKLLMLVLFLSSIMVLIGFSMFINNNYINEQEFLYDNKNLIEVNLEDSDQFSFLQEKLDDEVILGPANTIRLNRFYFDIFEHTKEQILKFPPHSVLPIELVKNPLLVFGRLPSEKNEVVIDKWIVDRILKEEANILIGIKYYDQIVGLTWENRLESGTIVGIVDTKNPNIYINIDEYQLMMINEINNKSMNFATVNNSPIADYFSFTDYKREILSDQIALPIPFSNLNLKENEILLNKNNRDKLFAKYPSNTITDKITFFGTEYTVVGFFEMELNEYHVITNSLITEELFYQFLSHDSYQKISLYSLNKGASINRLEELNIPALDLYDSLKENHHINNFRIEENIFSIILLIVSFIFLYFIMRSSLISRVYDVGVYRALGVKKSNVYRLFTSEIILMTLLTSVIGVLLISYLIIRVNNFSPVQLIHFPWYVSVLTILFIFACNLVVGLIPIFNLLRLTPSQILSKYDI